MDKRQTQIVEGEGLFESQINQDFKNWLIAWGPRIFYLVFAVVLVYAASQWWQRRQVTLLDTAFAQLESAKASGSPAALEAVARDHAGRGAVMLLATIEAADTYLEQARRGALPGANTTTGDGVLSQEEITEALTKANALFQIAHDKTSTASLPTIHVSALWGQASVSLQQGDFDEAGRLLGEVISLAEQSLLPSLAQIAQDRLDALTEIRTLAPMLSREQIASITPRTEIVPDAQSPLLPLLDGPIENEQEDQNNPEFEPPTSALDLELPLGPTPTPTEPPEEDSSDNDGSDS